MRLFEWRWGAISYIFARMALTIATVIDWTADCMIAGAHVSLVAHYFGASLIFSSYKNETTISRLKNLLNHFLLDDSLAIKQPQVDHLKPIFVPFGTDTMEAIGRPPLNASELNDPNHK